MTPPRPLTPLLLLLLGSLSRSTAQLTFNLTEPVTSTPCSQSVRLPCFVNNLKERDASVMIVEWKLGDRSVFVFDGSSKDKPITTSLSSAEMDLGLVPGGEVSLLIKEASEAVPGRYTCDVTELNRAGSTPVQLEERPPRMFGPVEDALIGLCLLLAVAIFWIQLGISMKVLKKPTYLFLIPGVAATVLVVVGLGLLISAEASPRASAGLAIALVGAPLALLLTQFFLSRETVEVDPKIVALAVLEAVGFLVALVGFALCVAAPCPLKRWPVLIAGIVIFVVFELAELVYVAKKMGSRCRNDIAASSSSSSSNYRARGRTHAGASPSKRMMCTLSTNHITPHSTSQLLPAEPPHSAQPLPAQTSEPSSALSPPHASHILAENVPQSLAPHTPHTLSTPASPLETDCHSAPHVLSSIDSASPPPSSSIPT